MDEGGWTQRAQTTIQQGLTGALSTVRTEGTGNHPGRRRLGTENQTDTGHAQWGTRRHCLLYIQRALADVGDGGGVRLGTTNQSDRGSTEGPCQLYIQRTQTTSETAPWLGTMGQSTVHSEGTANQKDRDTHSRAVCVLCM